MEPLYRISERLHQFYDLEGELDEKTFADTLESLEGEMEQKCLSVGLFVKTEQLNVDAIDVEIARLTKRKKRMKDTIDRVRNYLRYHMIETKTGSAKNALLTLSTKKSPPSLEITGKPPSQFVKTETVEKVDECGITAAIKAGAEFDGCALVRGDDQLVIS